MVIGIFLSIRLYEGWEWGEAATIHRFVINV